MNETNYLTCIKDLLSSPQSSFWAFKSTPLHTQCICWGFAHACWFFNLDSSSSSFLMRKIILIIWEPVQVWQYLSWIFFLIPLSHIWSLQLMDIHCILYYFYPTYYIFYHFIFNTGQFPKNFLAFFPSLSLTCFTHFSHHLPPSSGNH